MTDIAPEPRFTGTSYVNGRASGDVIATDLELSFWGGVDPWKGEVIDRHHPLSGQCLEGKVLVIPGGRGSCSGSGVMLELLLNGKGPAAMLFEREEDILTLGVVVAEEVFGRSIPVVTLKPEDFHQVLSARHVTVDGATVSIGRHQASAFSNTAPDELFGDVELSAVDRELLHGSRGEAAQTAMRIIVRMARLQGARQLMDVSQVHVDGCVYTGPGCLSFAQKLKELGGRVVVPTTLNSISVDHRRWRAQGIDASIGEPASRLGDVYTEMGARPTFTCAPYLLDTAPEQGEQVAWAESNAVVFANSVLGARTMKYPDFLDICIALTGRAPMAGPHVERNRKATFRVRVHEPDDVDDSFYPLLGYKVGALAGNRVALVEGLAAIKPTTDDLKAFGAAFATLSSAPMFHVLGVTPEAGSVEQVLATGGIETVELRQNELSAEWDELNSATVDTVDLVSLGNPHFSFDEVKRLALLCKGRTKHPDTAVVVTMGRGMHDKARAENLIGELEAFGVQFVTDTCWCMITDPIIPPAAQTIMTNSGKYAHYGPGITGRSFHFGGLAACVEAACTGSAERKMPGWMLGN